MRKVFGELKEGDKVYRITEGSIDILTVYESTPDTSYTYRIELLTEYGKVVLPEVTPRAFGYSPFPGVMYLSDPLGIELFYIPLNSYK